MQHNFLSPFSNKTMSFSENILTQLDQTHTTPTEIQKTQTKILDQKSYGISISPSSNIGSYFVNSKADNEETFKTEKQNLCDFSPLRNQDTNKPNRYFIDKLSKSNLMDIETSTAKQNENSLFFMPQIQSYQTPHNPLISIINNANSENSTELFPVPLQRNPSLIK